MLIKELFLRSQIVKKKYSLEEIRFFSKDFCSIDNISCIHIAGTNGKGSVATKISKVLQLSGYKVGLFTSPHIFSVRERIQINGRNISIDNLELGLKEIFLEERKKQVKLSFFEVLTVLSFWYFLKKKIEVGVFEVGLGGRLDATNIIKPILSVISSISYDHLDILGKDLNSIAKEKAGIIKPNIPTVIGPSVVQEIVKEIAFEKRSLISQVPIDDKSSYEVENIEIAKTAIFQIEKKFSISKEAITQGLNFHLPCRYEVVDTLGVPIIFDVAHNLSGLKRLMDNIQKDFPAKKMIFLLAISKNKNVEDLCNFILNFSSYIYLFDSKHVRLTKALKLQEFFKEKMPLDNFSIIKTINKEELVHHCKRENAVLIVCGTFFIMADVKSGFNLSQEKDEFDLNEKF